MFRLSPLSLILMLGVIVLWACNSAETVTPQRNFTSVDLVLDSPDLPAEWVVTKRQKVSAMYESTDDSATAELTSTTSIERVSQFIHRYRNIASAKGLFNDVFVISDRIPDGWNYEPNNADEFKFGCYKNVGEDDYIFCRGIFRYDEYIVDVYINFTSGEVPIEEIKQLFDSIDARIGSYLKEP